MKYLSFRILIAFIVLPPLLYVLTVNLIENRLTHQYYLDLKNTYLSDITNILNGQTSLKESINKSISKYMANRLFPNLGGKLDVFVITKTGNVIYPPVYPNEPLNPLLTDPVQLAESNFNTLNEGIDIQVEAKVIPYSLLAIFILFFYICLFLTGLYAYYRKGIAKDLYEEEKRKQELERLRMLEREQLNSIQALSYDREKLLLNYEQLQKTLESEKLQAEKTEDDLFEEIELLEKQLNDNLSMQQTQHQEINTLKEKIQDLEKGKILLSRQKHKEISKIEKRFKILYKNIDISPRAIESLINFTDEMSLKAEEIIHQLNDDDAAVPVKRKVFSKKGKITAFETIFAYSGRLYFRKTKKNKVEILTIGTKNSQNRDLAYLDSIQ